MTTTKKQKRERAVRAMWATPTWLTTTRAGELGVIAFDTETHAVQPTAPAQPTPAPSVLTIPYAYAGAIVAQPTLTPGDINQIVGRVIRSSRPAMQQLPRRRRHSAKQRHFTGVGSTMRLGHLRLDHERVGAAYAAHATSTRTRWRVNAGGNRHDRKRWTKVFASVVAVANDALLEGDRRRAILTLCEVLPLTAAIWWTRRERTIVDEMIEFPLRQSELELTRSVVRASDLRYALGTTHPQIAQYQTWISARQAWQTDRQAEGTRVHREIEEQLHGTRADVLIVDDPNVE